MFSPGQPPETVTKVSGSNLRLPRKMQSSTSVTISPELICIGLTFARIAKSSGPWSGNWILKRGFSVAEFPVVIHSKFGSPGFVAVAEKVCNSCPGSMTSCRSIQGSKIHLGSPRKSLAKIMFSWFSKSHSSWKWESAWELEACS